VRAVLRTAAVAGTLGGLPSTIWTLRQRGDLLASTRAAGTLLVSGRARPGTQLAAGVLAHALVSIFWAGVLCTTLPRRATVVAGAGGGLAIGLLDRRLARHLAPAIAELPCGPQLADHVAFGVLVAVAARREFSAPAPPPPAG
jgi:hypothetical protein